MPEWVRSTAEELRHMLIGDGYDDEKLGKMKMERIYKIQFMKYKESYIRWYGIEKHKPEE